MTRERTITRPTLAKYAAALGPDSIAADALATFDAIRQSGNRAQATMTNNGFKVYRAGGQEFPRPVRPTIT